MKYFYIFFYFFTHDQIPTILPVFFSYTYMHNEIFIFSLLEYANIGDYIYEKIAHTVAF